MYIRAILLCLIVSTVGCASLPPEEVQENWKDLPASQEVNGSYYAGTQSLIVRLRFSEDVHGIRAMRCRDVPGNGLDIYTEDHVILKQVTSRSVEIHLNRNLQVEGKLYFLVRWETADNPWPEANFVLRGWVLYCIDRRE